VVTLGTNRWFPSETGSHVFVANGEGCKMLIPCQETDVTTSKSYKSIRALRAGLKIRYRNIHEASNVGSYANRFPNASLLVLELG